MEKRELQYSIYIQHLDLISTSFYAGLIEIQICLKYNLSDYNILSPMMAD